MRIFLFGATGDLSVKKLYPALYALQGGQKLPQDHEIICIGRRPYSQLDFEHFIMDKVGGVRDVKQWFGFIKHLKYYQVAFEELSHYERLKDALSIDPSDIHIFYMASGPEYFEVIASHSAQTGLLQNGNLNHRIVIEKPFGKDLKSASAIHNHLARYVVEDQIYRMDHYLGKEMIQNILMLRFDNTLFDASWNKDHIDHVQITVAETYGVFERAGYYDTSGAVRDMIQSHLLQMLALVAMSPTCLDQDALCEAKTAVLKNLHIENALEDVVLGQYIGNDRELGYRQEKGVAPLSQTETFAAMRLQIDLPRWEGVDFYLLTGKKMANKVSEISIVYKRPPHATDLDVPQNVLTIQIQPEEGTKVIFNMKKPGDVKARITREMNFCQSCLIDYNAPEAYETLINEVIEGNHSLYARWDEVKHAWIFIDELLNNCALHGVPVQQYKAGENGPHAAHLLLQKANRVWRGLKA